MPKALVVLLSLVCGAVANNVSADVEKPIRRAIERTLQSETERHTEDVVRTAIRKHVRSIISKDIDGLARRDADDLIERIMAKGINEQLKTFRLLRETDAQPEESGILAVISNNQDTTDADVVAEKDKKGKTVVPKSSDVADDMTTPELVNDVPDVNHALVEAAVIDGQISRVEDALPLSEQMTADLYGRDIWTKEWVIMTDSKTRNELLKKGYSFSNESYLEIFDQVVANVQAPASFDLYKDFESLAEQIGEGQILVDYNHVYRNAEASIRETVTADAKMPAELVPISHKKLVIGMVDTALNKKHPALLNARLTQQHFLPDTAKAIDAHGTSVASIMVGYDERMQGVAPNATLYNASVFFDVEQEQPIATATDILKGLNWLVKNGVNVINMSLSGPANRLLEFGIQKLCSKGIYVVAAAGNAGPLSEPLYPAGYECAVAVTAIDVDRKLYRYAVQGEHIDVAAFGVDVLAASDNEKVSPASGTSIAAPFITVVLADSLMTNKEGFNLQALLSNSIDLGVAGFDPQYGHGLLMLPPSEVDVATAF